MTLFFYDTETNGLPEWSKPSEDPCQPHITQLAGMLTDEDGEILGSVNALIKPDGWTIPDDIAALTGITTERATEYGIPIRSAMTVFLELWGLCDVRIAHNESFDMRMVRIELMRDIHPPEFPDTWKAAPAYCTAANSTKIVNLPPTEKMMAVGRKNAKTPNLSEAYRFFTGKELVKAHNGAADVMGCRAVYFGIRKHLGTASAPAALPVVAPIATAPAPASAIAAFGME